MSDSIKKLQDLFAKFPTIGSRTASRFVFYMLKLPKERVDELVNAMYELKSKIKFCNFCFNPHEGQGSLCPICQNPSRNRKLLCLVEKEADLFAIENSKRYTGLYFILGGVLNLRRNNMDDLRINQLTKRIENTVEFGLPKIDFEEIIFAINPTPEGKSTSLLVQKALKENFPNFSIKITYLAQGLPAGGELEYADEDTLESAFEGRR